MFRPSCYSLFEYYLAVCYRTMLVRLPPSGAFLDAKSEEVSATVGTRTERGVGSNLAWSESAWLATLLGRVNVSPPSYGDQALLKSVVKGRLHPKRKAAGILGKNFDAHRSKSCRFRERDIAPRVQSSCSRGRTTHHLPSSAAAEDRLA